MLGYVKSMCVCVGMDECVCVCACTYEHVRNEKILEKIPLIDKNVCCLCGWGEVGGTKSRLRVDVQPP